MTERNHAAGSVDVGRKPVSLESRRNFAGVTATKKAVADGLELVRAAHVARRFPQVLELVADGRLHLSAVVLLARYLRQGNAEELLSAATHRSKADVELMLAAKFPRTDLLALVTQNLSRREAPGPLETTPVLDSQQTSVSAVENQGPAQLVHAVSRVSPLSTQSYAVQFTLSTQGHDLLRRAQELLGHQIPSGDIAQVFEKVLALAVSQLEKRKFAATSSPRPARTRPSSNPHYIPAEVKRAVRARDGDQCTFVSENGHRCEARTRLEFDHVLEVARGGVATVEGLRLRCQAHNQYTAERTFGTEFMRQRRIAAAELRAAQAQRREEKARDARQSRDKAAAAKHVEESDVVCCLRNLGFSGGEARRAAELCEGLPDQATLEQRVRVALSYFRVRGTKFVPAAGLRSSA